MLGVEPHKEQLGVALDEHFQASVMTEASCAYPDCDAAEGGHDAYVAVHDEDPAAIAEQIEGVEYAHTVEVPLPTGDLAKFDFIR